MRTIGAKFTTLVLSGCLVLSPVTPAYSQADQSAGEVTAQIPQADIRRPAEVVPAAVGTGVLWDDLVETRARGRVRITLDDGSILNVGSDSSLRVVQHDAQTRQTDLTLTFGKMRVRTRKLQSGQRFEVRTPTAILGVIGTDFYVFADGTRTIVIVFEGMLLLTSINPAIIGSTQVFAGQQAVVPSGQPPQPPSPTQPTQVQESIQETNVGEDLPAPEMRRVEGPQAGSKWPLIIAIAAIAAVSIIIPVVVINEEGGPEEVIVPPPPPPSRGGGGQ